MPVAGVMALPAAAPATRQLTARQNPGTAAQELLTPRGEACVALARDAVVMDFLARTTE